MKTIAIVSQPYPVSAFYPARNGDFVYDVTVTKDETRLLPQRYCAHLTNAEYIEGGKLASIRVELPDGYGPTVNDAMRALDEHFDMWRQARQQTASEGSP